MRSAFVIGFTLALAACPRPAPAERPAPAKRPERTPPALSETPPDLGKTEAFPSPNGSAVLVYTYAPRVNRVRMIAGTDTADVFDSNMSRSVGIEWLAPDLGRVWVPFGNYTYDAVYAEPSSMRVSLPFTFAVAVDAGAETVMTFDPDAVTLRALWSGEPLATWAPSDVDLYDLRHECDPSFTLSNRAAAVRYDCGEGAREREIFW